jgi:UDP-glucose:(heptosyl)LPS alpha-1,3-glucosyltransferase
MNIGIQIERFDPVAGGAERYTEQLVGGLLARGHGVHVFARTARSLPAGTVFHAVPAGGLMRWQKDHSYARNTDALAGAAGLDVLLSTGRTVLRGLKLLFNYINPKQVLARHDEARQYGRRPLPHVVAVSHMVAGDMKSTYAVPDDRLHVIYNGVDLERFHPQRLAARRSAARQRLGLADGALVFALVAHNFKLKGVAELIAAVALLNTARTGFQVVIAGKANARRYQGLSRRLGCIDRVLFSGPLETVEDLYAAADVYVHPTWYDPCSLVVLEALASGLPVITTRFNGASEIITEGREGFLLDTPRDVKDLADRMGYFFERSRIQPMGIQARSLAEQFSWDRNVDEMLRVLELAAAQKRLGPEAAPAGYETS